MNKRYHLILEKTKSDLSHLNPAISITLVDTLDFNPVFELKTMQEYRSAVQEMVILKYKDDVRIYDLTIEKETIKIKEQ
jgi:hypothetical protein